MDMNIFGAHVVFVDLLFSDLCERACELDAATRAVFGKADKRKIMPVARTQKLDPHNCIDFHICMFFDCVCESVSYSGNHRSGNRDY